MSKALAVGRSPQDIAATSEERLPPRFMPAVRCFVADDNGKLQPLTHPQGMTPWDDAIAQWSFDKGLPAGAGINAYPACRTDFQLKSGQEPTGWWWWNRGICASRYIPEQQRLLETFTLFIADGG